MASNNVCRTCLRAIVRQQSQLTKESIFATQTRLYNRSSSRPISSSARHLQQPATTQDAAPSNASPYIRQPSTKPKLEDLPPVTSAQLRKAVQGNTATATSFAQKLRNAAPGITEPYIAYAATDELFRKCYVQADYKMKQRRMDKEVVGKIEGEGEGLDVGEGESWWYTELNLLPTFNTWAQITFLHMYIVTLRLRMLPASQAPIWHQQLVDHFFLFADERMEYYHAISQRAHRNKYLKDLHMQWRGVIAAYDEGLIKGDAALASALWRNVFQGNLEVDPVDLAAVTAYLRREIANVSNLSLEELKGDGVQFGKGWDLKEEKRAVLVESRGMKESAALDS